MWNGSSSGEILRYIEVGERPMVEFIKTDTQLFEEYRCMHKDDLSVLLEEALRLECD